MTPRKALLSHLSYASQDQRTHGCRGLALFARVALEGPWPMRKRNDPSLSGVMIACDSPARAPIGICAVAAEKNAPKIWLNQDSRERRRPLREKRERGREWANEGPRTGRDEGRIPRVKRRPSLVRQAVFGVQPSINERIRWIASGNFAYEFAAAVSGFDLFSTVPPIRYESSYRKSRIKWLPQPCHAYAFVMLSFLG